MDSRSTVDSLWRAARGGLARLNALLREDDGPQDAVFQAARRNARPVEAERRIAEARRARTRP